MKTAVDKVKKGKGRVVNARFSVMCALRRYARRWLVERFFAWLQWKRRLLVRWEYYANNFLGFVQLASITMMLKRFEIGSSPLGHRRRRSVRYGVTAP